MKKTKLVAILTALFLYGVSAANANAVARFTFTPTAGSYTVGNEFTVDLGVNSDTEKVVAIDVVGTYDKNLLELVKMEKITNESGFQFNWDQATTPKIDINAGTFSATLTPTSSSSLEGVVANHGLIKLTFRGKSAGTGNVALTCQQGSINDANILNPSSVDVATCSSNQSGSYTLTASTTTTTSPTATPTPTTAPVTTTSATNTLPETGSLGATVGLVVFGVVCVLGALFLGLL